MFRAAFFAVEIVAFLLVVFVLNSSLAAAPPDLPTPIHGSLTYGIYENGTKIGTETVHVIDTGTEQTIAMRTDISVYAFIFKYTYASKSEEKWLNGKFSSFSSTTIDNGSPPRNVSVVSEKNGLLLVTVNGVTSEVNAVRPASVWSRDMLVDGQCELMFDPRTSASGDACVELIGAESIVLPGKGVVIAQHFEINGVVRRDMWFIGPDLVKETLPCPDHTTIAFDEQ
jgi:hypothetical protein